MDMLQRILKLEEAQAASALMLEDIKSIPGKIDALKAERAKAIEDGNAAVLAKTTAEIEAKTAEFAAVTTRMDEFEAQIVRKGMFDASGQGAAFKSIISQLQESDQYKAFLGSAGAKTMDAVRIEKGGRRSLARKAVFDSGSTGSEPFQTELQLDPVIAPVEEPVLMQLMPFVDLGPNASVKYPEVTSVLYLETALSGSVLIDATTVGVDNASGVKVGSTLKFDNDAAKTAVVASVNLDTDVITLTEATGFTASTGQAVTSEEFTFTQESTDGKPRYAPEMRVTTVEKTATTHNITATVPATRQSIKQAPVTELMLRTFIARGIRQGIDTNGFYGVGDTTEWGGVMVNASALTYAWSEGVVGDKKMDAVRRAATKLRLANYSPSAVVLHPLDLEDIELSKDSQGRYILLNVAIGQGITVMWRMRVLESAQIKQGDFLVADFAMLGFFFGDGDLIIEVATQHDKDFKAHKLLIRGHEDIGFVLWHPSAAVVGEFDAEPS